MNDLHRVTWQDGKPTFHCDGDRTSPCHQYPTCDDEYWPCTHPFEPHDECWQIGWLDASPEEAWFDGGTTLSVMPRVDGLIETEWEGECLLWCYVESDELAAAVGGSGV